MRNDRKITDIFNLADGLYPHLKITGENFPRVLATRRIEDDDAEYYGAFLSKTSVRILLDFINRVFKLRLCDLEIDGSFAMPCTQFYSKRCVAPCVARICGREKYMQRVSLARHFIANNRRNFLLEINEIIDTHADALEFERAAEFRDILLAVEKYWQQPRWDVWLDDTVDTIAVEDTPAGYAIFLATTRGRHVLGRKVFTADREDAESGDIALAQILEAFYRVHLPKEIRVSRDFYGRRELTQKLTDKFGRPAKIIVVYPGNRGLNAARALYLGREEHELDKAKPIATPEFISRQLKNMFGLCVLPTRVEAFDVAHISGTGMTSANSVWINGRFITTEYSFEISGLKSELLTLVQAVRFRLDNADKPPPDLILLDGGKNQLNAVLRSFGESESHPPIVAAVKPRQKHSSISAFLSRDLEPVLFDVDSPAHAMLQLLRDDAHDLANRAHRDYRELMPFYELSGATEPLVVPLRYHAENGGAEDLIPIETR